MWLVSSLKTMTMLKNTHPLNETNFDIYKNIHNMKCKRHMI